MNKVPVKVVLTHPVSKEKGLTYSTPYSSAFDVYCCEDVEVEMLSVTKVDLGFKMQLPDGYAALLMPRSGLGSKIGLELANTVGLIDTDYRGNVIAALRLKPIMRCVKDDPDHGQRLWDTGRALFRAGERIGQIAIVPMPQAEFEVVDELDTTQRGEGGFGHTGT
ncbi:MAG: dUTP diphosphatase [Shewanella sp.]|nr:dUTP diphosphatase [Shewanella sp.]